MPERIPHLDTEIITDKQSRNIQYSIRICFPDISSLITRQDGSNSSQTKNSIKPLYELKGGQAGRIVSIKPNPLEGLKELAKMGITTNDIVRMMFNYGHYVVFKVGHKEFTADKEITEGITVQILRQFDPGTP